MTSTLRTVSSNIVLPQPGGVVALSFRELPIQFSHDRNGTLDFVFANGFTKDSDLSKLTTIYVRGSNNAAIRLIDKIGPNIITWLENNEGADVGSVTIYEKPIVFRANLLMSETLPNDVGVMFESRNQISFEQSPGTEANKYFSTFLFKKPLVLKYTKLGITYYRAFSTQFSPQV